MKQSPGKDVYPTAQAFSPTAGMSGPTESANIPQPAALPEAAAGGEGDRGSAAPLIGTTMSRARHRRQILRQLLDGVGLQRWN
jgi:hypothetical protein